MRTRAQNPFTTITTSGLLLPIDMLARIANGDADLKGLTGKDYHLRSGERPNEAAARAWNQCVAAWKSFRKRFDALPASDFGTTTTRDEWLLPLFQELGYGRLQTKKALDFDGTEYPITHGWEDHVPIHLLSARLPLDRRTPGVSGAAARAPYSLMQELLNRSATHRWGFVTNGLKLFLLRDNAALARAANVEFDLEAMMDGEVYPDFFLLYCLCHQSRVEIRGTGSEAEDAKPNPEDCWLEDWATQADQQGTRAREKLRDGVESSVKSLGAGFLTTKGNDALRDRLRSGELSTQDFYRQLLRLVYRILMLLVAEEKRSESGHNLLHPPETTPETRERYARYYSVGRIRSLAYERRGTSHTDLYESLKVLFTKLRTGYAPLGIPGMGSFLFSDDSTPDLDDAAMGNQDLLDTFRNLCYTEDTSGRGGGIRRPVDFGNLGSEELGSVYESLLELHPLIDTDEGPFTLGTAAGHERKTTGSYYTPTSLINCLLDSALDPVVHEAINVPDAAEAERKLLDLKVCDPACGSGHFLIAAADRMAMHLARIRTGDDQPNTIDIQHAKRDIIGRCIYGVDMNPMAVELCKVSLWMEALEPGKPLSFLDHHIQCGNSLIGATPRLLVESIPDDAFKPIEGDDRDVCGDLKKRNKREREDYKSGQSYLFEQSVMLGNLPAEFAKLAVAEDDSLESLAAKRQKHGDLVKEPKYQNARLWADLWCAAFVWQKEESDLGRLCPTGCNPDGLNPAVRSEILRLARKYQFHHWHLAFPDVFCSAGEDDSADSHWQGGFDLVVGNPPWDKWQPEAKKFFGPSRPDIAEAKTGAVRERLIGQLSESDPNLFIAWQEHRRTTSGVSHILKNSGLLPLGSKGNLNLYRVFAELGTKIVHPRGRVGMVVQSGFATDSSGTDLLIRLMESSRLARVWDFENRGKFFPDVHAQFRFALITLTGSEAGSDVSEFAWLLRSISDADLPHRTILMSASDIRLLSDVKPTAPVFRSSGEFEITKQIYKNGHRLGRYVANGTFSCLGEFFNMSRDSRHFHSTGSATHLPLYEAKYFHHFDHRFASWIDGEVQASSSAKKADCSFEVIPKFFVSKAEVFRRHERTMMPHNWHFGFRDVASATNERTAIAAILPPAAVGHNVNMFFGDDTEQITQLTGNANSFAFDFVCRQKVGGMHVTLTILKSMPIASCQERSDISSRWIVSRVLELSFSSNGLQEFARDCNYDGPPFRWDQERRFAIRCELDAAYFHLYLGSEGEWGADNATLREMFPTPRDAVDYIMDTFPIVRRKDEAKYGGEYKTKTEILRIYDAMAEVVRANDAIRVANPGKSDAELQSQFHTYQTQLDPPPGPPTDDQGNFIPFANWTDEIRAAYKDIIHLDSVVDDEIEVPSTNEDLLGGFAYPSPGYDHAVCSAAMQAVDQMRDIESAEHLDLVLLASHPQFCKPFLDEADATRLEKLTAAKDYPFKPADDQDVQWSRCREHLERRSAIQVDRSDDSQRISKGDDFDSVLAEFETETTELVALAVRALEAIRLLRQKLDSANQVQRLVIERLNEARLQYQLAA